MTRSADDTTDRKPHHALDPRRTPYRPDLAAQHLYGRVNVPRYTVGEKAQVIRPAVPLRRQPAGNQGFDTEIPFGALVTVFDETEGWSWIQNDRDQYVGYVPADSLSRRIRPSTHWVTAIGTFVYPVPDIKAPPLMHLSLTARLSAATADERFVGLKDGGFVVARHVREVGRHARDFVAIAEQLIGTPYLWGGRTRVGLDCSGLVQITLEAAGVAAPRDSDMQQAELGGDVAVRPDLEGLIRGDLVFWPGHVGIMADSVMLIHANAHHMAVVVETLPEVVERSLRGGSRVSAVKRLAALSA